MCAENNCQLSTVNFPRVAHTHYARIPRPVSYVRFLALVADSVRGMHVAINCKNVAREGRKSGKNGKKPCECSHVVIVVCRLPDG